MPKSLSQTSQQELHRHKYPVFASADYSSGPQLYKDTQFCLTPIYRFFLLKNQQEDTMQGLNQEAHKIFTVNRIELGLIFP